VSWRTSIEAAIPIRNPDTHDSQKSIEEVNCADIAGSADKHSEEESSKLLEILADACRGLAITPTEVKAALAPEDIEDWRKGLLKGENFTAFAQALVEQRQREGGERPDYYTFAATCKLCGPIWLWYAANLPGCPWCHNRGTGKPIPRPCNVCCGDCVHFNRHATHPHLGHCAQGEPETIVGNWDTDRRYCERFLPSASIVRNSAYQIQMRSRPLVTRT